MISGVRDTALALACVRHGLPAVHGRGIDRLPGEVVGQFEGSLVQRLDGAELSRAFRAALHGLLSELRSADAELGGRVQETLLRLTETAAEN